MTTITQTPAQPPTGILRKDPQGSTGTWTYAHLSATDSYALKTGPGILHTLTFNTPVASSVVTIYDGTSTSGTVIGVITLPSSLLSSDIPSAIYDVEFLVGLFVVQGTGASDITIAYA